MAAPLFFPAYTLPRGTYDGLGCCRTAAGGTGSYTYQWGTLDDCKTVCLNSNLCTAIEYYNLTTRCELHTDTITYAVSTGSCSDIFCSIKSSVYPPSPPPPPSSPCIPRATQWQLNISEEHG
eukprot:4939559-Prymnesium_polylepis.1